MFCPYCGSLDGKFILRRWSSFQYVGTDRTMAFRGGIRKKRARSPRIRSLLENVPIGIYGYSIWEACANVPLNYQSLQCSARSKYQGVIGWAYINFYRHSSKITMLSSRNRRRNMAVHHNILSLLETAIHTSHAAQVDDLTHSRRRKREH